MLAKETKNVENETRQNFAQKNLLHVVITPRYALEWTTNIPLGFVDHMLAVPEKAPE